MSPSILADFEVSKLFVRKYLASTESHEMILALSICRHDWSNK